MCKKSVYYNTYSDGTSDITERICSCSPGTICPDPRIVEFDRSYDCPRSQAKLTQDRDDSASPASPSSSRSVSPASSATSIDNTNERSRHHRRSQVYVNGQKVSSTSSTNTNTMSQPIPIRRSSTMPYGGEPMPERGRRPIIVEPMVPLPQAMHAPRTSPRPAPGSSHYPLGPSPIPRTTTSSSRPVDVFQHTTAPLASPRRRTPTRDFHDFRTARDARDLRNELRTDYREYRSEYRSPTRAEPSFSLRRRTSEREPPVTTTTTPASSINRRNSLSTPATRDFLTPHYRSAAYTTTSPSRPRADSSPIGYASADDAAGREDRRRRRRHNRDTFAPSSVPTAPPAFGNIYSPHKHSRTGSGLDSGFASSYESSGYTTTSPAGSSFTSPTPSSTASAAVSEVRTSPAAAAVKKNLRWQDDERRRQNEKIDRRPKLSRDETITPANAHAHAKVQGEVKSILKNTTTPSTSPSGRARSQSRHRDTFNDDARSTTNATIGSSSHVGRRGSFRGDLEGLAGGVSGLNIHGNTPPTSPRVAKPRSSSRSPRSPRSPHHDESEAEKARLRDRFDQKPVLAPFSKPLRSHSIGPTYRRRDYGQRDEYY